MRKRSEKRSWPTKVTSLLHNYEKKWKNEYLPSIEADLIDAGFSSKQISIVAAEVKIRLQQKLLKSLRDHGITTEERIDPDTGKTSIHHVVKVRSSDFKR